MVQFIPSRRGSALIVWLIITVLLTIMTTSFLEKILGLGQISGWITNSAQSYSLATWLIEKQLMDANMTKQEPWNIVTVNTGTTDTGLTLSATTGGTTMPVHLKWNSSFDSDWNIISMGDPVQIVIPPWLYPWNTSVQFRFRVPTISGATSTGVSASTAWSWIILWTFGYSGASLYASGETEIFKWSDITGSSKSIASYSWLISSWSGMTFDWFYNDTGSGTWLNGAKCNPYNCTLKLSMIRPIITQGWQVFPFLEYQIDFGINIPSQYMVIDSSVYNYGYIRSRQIRIPQITTNTATDFAVLE